MTKTLTEQWREGKLPIGKYYIKTKWWGCDGKWHYEKEEDIDYLDGDWRFYQDDAVVEVLAPVPSYDEVKEMSKKIERLQEQLKEANDIIEDMRPFIQASMSRQTFTRILNYEEKWGGK